MTITPKKIDRLIKWHKKNGGYYLQLGCMWIYLKHMVFTATDSREIQENIDKIESALTADEVAGLNKNLLLPYQPS